MPDQSMPAADDLTGYVAGYIHETTSRDLPANVADRAKQHTLDAMVAVISGSTLKPGRLASSFVGSRATTGDATVVGPGTTTAPELAALANGMAAHADESDDVNDLARIHPGASVIPAALAGGEVANASGQDLLRAVACGYNVGCSINVSLFQTLEVMQRQKRSTHGIGQTFGAMAAAASLAGLEVDQLRYVLSYTAQQVGGMFSFYRDQHHIGKAFASAGMQAHNGVQAVEVVKAGFTDITDIFDTSPNVFDAFGDGPDPARLVTELETMQYIVETDLKQYPVGMPIQAAVQALGAVLARPGVKLADIERVDVRLPSHGARIVDGRSMPDIHLQYVLSLLLLDGDITFASAHDYERREQPEVQATIERINLIHDPSLDPPHRPNTRVCALTAHLRDGRTESHDVDAAFGSRLNPMDWATLEHKAADILSSALSADQASEFIGMIREVESVGSVRDLRPYLTTLS